MHFFKNLLDVLRGSHVPEPSSKSDPNEQCLIVHFQYGLTDLEPYFEQSKDIEAAVEAAGVGDYDGHEMAVSLEDGFHYIYGPNADRLLEVVEPLLRQTSWLTHAKLTRRYGSAKQDDVMRVVTYIGPQQGILADGSAAA